MIAANTILFLINFVVGIVEALLGVRILLKLLGANPAAPFVNWVYVTSNQLITPFQGMFPSPVLEGGFVLEFSAIFALIVYAFVGYLLTEFLGYLTYQSERIRRRTRER